MNHHSSLSVSLWVALVSGLALLALPAVSHADTYKEVEVHVAGPWAYATDPNSANSNQIVVVSPNVNHLMTVITGGDAQAYSGKLDPGIYTLSFTTVSCAKHRPVAPPHLYDVPTTTIPSAVSDVLGAKGKDKRVAIYLPKPCYYESYRETNLKISTAAIDERTPEGNYTIWMVLHYTIVDGANPPALSGKLDSGNPFSPTSVPFSNSTMPPTSSAISVVAYYANVGEDYACDSHSAMHLDASMSLWSQTGTFRLLPELDSKGNQSHRYNYDTTKCPQAMSVSMNENAVTAESLLKQIEGIRADLTNSMFDPATGKTLKLKATMLPLWKPAAPVELKKDLDQALATLQDLQARHPTLPPGWVSQFLIVTEYDRAPGRADCHAMQLNIDSAVP